MLMRVLKSNWISAASWARWARGVSNWAVDRVLGSLAHVSALTPDDDMCLLLRIEIPRSCYRPAS
jgi:hypothetical protein